MYLKLDYIIQNEEVCICRCYGYEEVLNLPEQIDGKPVTSLYAYALSASRPVHAPEGVRQIVLGEEERGFSEEKELSGEMVREVYLPGSLKRIGDYAFYFCRNLHTLHIQGNLTDLGGGVFMWCKSLSRLVFTNISRDNPGAKSVLGELTRELEAELTYEDGTHLRLTFPEYYEESVENTPARIIEIHWHGSGYKYRQCFQSAGLNLKHYDELFPYAVANEFTDTCTRIAVNRLRTPLGLSEGAREQYLAYLREHGEEIIRQAVTEDDLETVRLFASQELLNREMLEQATMLASRGEKAELGSYLMDYKREHFRTKRRTYEL